MIIYKTERLIIRNWETTDAQDMYDYAKSLNVGPNAGWKPHETVEESEKIISMFNEKMEDYAIVLKETNKVIGGISLTTKPNYDGYKEIGYVLNENYWNKGLITEGVKGILRYAFTETNAMVVAINHFSFNLASKKVVQKCGFTYEGLLRKYYQMYNDKLLDVLYYSMTKEEYFEKNSCYNLKLCFPTSEDKELAIQYKKEHFDNGEFIIHGDAGLDHTDNYEEWLKNVQVDLTRDDGKYVPATTYFAMICDDNGVKKIIGTIQIRHKLNESLLIDGGHIGYSVAPSERKKGYGSEMLRQSLIICKQLGLRKVLIACDKSNIASAGTIIKRGGKLENEVSINGEITQRYWINII